MILRNGIARPVGDGGDFLISFDITSGSVTISYKTKEMDNFEDVPNSTHSATTGEVYSLGSCDIMATMTGVAKVTMERV